MLTNLVTRGRNYRSGINSFHDTREARNRLSHRTENLELHGTPWNTTRNDCSSASRAALGAGAATRSSHVSADKECVPRCSRS
jgi:hypothetical protein